MFSSNTSQVSSDAVYVEDVFSNFLYTGNGSTQTITNGIDLAGKGGMVWIKTRNVVGSNYVQDTARGATQSIYTNSTAASGTANILSSFTSSGFVDNNQFSNGDTLASWTFRKQPKFFDVVTYTGNGSGSRSIAHSLGSVPGFIIVKATSTTGDWAVWHQSTGSSQGYLNTTAAFSGTVQNFAATQTSSTTFDVYGPAFGSIINTNGVTYVAYLFAHNAGGFGLTGTDNVISCGSYTGNGATPGTSVTLGWEPQWIMVKRSSAAEDWMIVDNMRGMPVYSGQNQGLYPNKTDEETAQLWGFSPTATGFQLNGTNTRFNAAGSTYIYIAIRRGPMKTPTSGTRVFRPLAASAGGTTNAGNTFNPDLLLTKFRGSTGISSWVDRLRGQIPANNTQTIPVLRSESTAAETSSTSNSYLTGNGGHVVVGSSTEATVGYFFGRAPGFFDEVCYTGTGSTTTFSHNLGVVPELMIVKRRDSTGFWAVYSAATGAANVLELQSSAASTSGTAWNSTSPTASVFTVGNTIATGASGGTYVAYLFASCPGVSKVGTYTGNGSSQTINCGFTGGARFVMIKRTDSTGDWYVWDTARGIVSANDPRLSLNTTAAEVTTDDSIDPNNSGFIVNQVTATNINVSSATYIYLAIA